MSIPNGKTPHPDTQRPPLNQPQASPDRRTGLGFETHTQQDTSTSTEGHNGTTHEPQSELDEVIIAVMGATGSGKSTFINTACGSEELEVSASLFSCTSEVQLSHPFVLDGRRVRLIDTPGFDDTTKSDTDILKMIAMFLSSAYERGKTLAGVIYVHRISDHRMGGVSTRNFRMFRRLCGDGALKNVVIVTNMWNEVKEDLGKRREHELRTQDTFFKPVLDEGAVMVRHNHTKESAHRVLGYLIHKDPTILQVVREISIEKKGIDETAAGEEINKVLIAQAKAHRKQMEELLQEHKDALREKDEQARREIEEDRRKLEAEMKRNQLEAQKLADANFEKFQKEREAYEKKVKEDMEKAEKRRLADLEQLKEEARKNAAGSAEWLKMQADYQQRLDDIRDREHQAALNAKDQQATLLIEIEKGRRQELELQHQKQLQEARWQEQNSALNQKISDLESRVAQKDSGGGCTIC
ncbi:P-loop containing nucleoside triphosphate hydrolase protein [Ephemerocybe angulata]|uniref:P-loop containing nucleoside triphosphate hydrolase protein n=1 Tax=Ephemerocybe angulata TaxID=980116 RepID=A0A8H6HW92_9AGAR|nr:P-loop containing nucleoside triphosphate hydrolase protein [Tulosesus angulatus]